MKTNEDILIEAFYNYASLINEFNTDAETTQMKVRLIKNYTEYIIKQFKGRK